ncbi:alkaline phosphatase family protein (plasmid) [Halobaculum sp. CBA1158]|uniref:alkaline phosphatase family protein n=1 Tax=Halobaculum sp. CBA1158 TaxID=2904243 RepID=UPI001F15FBD4|nr:alkaline phosphatase family protein [Halobaculum sp. CBA1158]UIP01539.1 alkaline phosphatase family protein [Halobaculum sp. CBA1158]
MKPDGEAAFVLGFDGVPWDLLADWVEQGELPAFARLFEEGASGPLHSTTPASTPLAWPSIATGRRPDGHGVYWFRQLQSDYSHRVATSDDVTGPRLWDLLAPATVANVPMTYPARPIDGHLVTGMMTPGSGDGFTHPPTLAETLADEVPEYRIGLDWQRFDGDEGAFVEEIGSVVDSRERLLEYLLGETTFRLGFVVFTAPDRLQHLVWDESVLLDHYRRLDEVLARVHEHVEERDGTLLVVSDHGFGPIERVVSPNRVLERAGLLARRGNDAGVRGVLGRLGVDKTAVRGWLDRLGIDDEDVVERLPQGLVDMVAMQVPGDNAVYDIDYPESDAFVRGDGCLYVNRTDRFDHGTVEPTAVPELKRQIADLFEGVTDPETGEDVLVVHDGDDCFPDDPESPDLVVEGIEGYEVHTPLTDGAVFDARETAASHRPEGILLATGPDIDPGARLDDASVVDVFPTVLHALGESIPPGVDGDVLRSAFADGSDPAERDLRVADEMIGDDATTRADETGDNADEGGADDTDEGGTDEAVEARLRGLGYID